MKLSTRWFPTNFPAQVDWFGNFNTNFADVAASLGFDPAVVASVDNDNQVMQFLAAVFQQVKSYEDAVRQYRKIITEGNIGADKPQFPKSLSLSLPVEVDTGIFERLSDLVDQIRVANGYTDEIGALLQILPTKPADKPVSDIKPTANVFAAAMGHHFSVVVEGREKATTFDVFIRRDGTEKWEMVKTASGKSVDVVVELTVAGMPERIQVMIQLMKNNQPYGQPSDAVYVTLNP